jgi:hypothetical protein
MSSDQSRLTQSFLALDDKDFNAVPVLNKALVKAINEHKDAYHSSMGTVLTALAITTGELILMGGEEREQLKASFSKILDAYINTGIDGARTGPDNQRSLVRRLRQWPWSKVFGAPLK